jgi:hypothetical protein
LVLLWVTRSGSHLEIQKETRLEIQMVIHSVMLSDLSLDLQLPTHLDELMEIQKGTR